MTDPAGEALVAAGLPAFRGAARFARAAMGTTFQVFIAGEPPTYAEQAAQAALADLERLEEDLSRFVPTGDVARLSAAAPGEKVRVGLDAFECLRIAERVRRETGGAFDVTAGSGCGADGAQAMLLDESDHSVALARGGVGVDLGGIGKGYALDRMAEILRDWTIASALLDAGGSTVLALEPPADEDGWPVALGGAGTAAGAVGRVLLAGRALAGSAASPSHPHIFDPRTGRPALGKRGAWALAPSAAEADALSTAFFVMPADEVRRYCDAHANVSAMLAADAPGGPQVVRFGPGRVHSRKE